MKKIINNRKYDTETATQVGEEHRENGLGGHYSECLYRKRNGEYFLCGEGDAFSRYAERVGSDMSGGSNIIPLSYEQAGEWVHTWQGDDAYEAEFGEVSEDGGSVLVGVRVSDRAKALLDREAARTGVTRASIVERLILEGIR